MKLLDIQLSTYSYYVNENALVIALSELSVKYQHDRTWGEGCTLLNEQCEI